MKIIRLKVETNKGEIYDSASGDINSYYFASGIILLKDEGMIMPNKYKILELTQDEK